MNPRSGENPPLISSSRSQICRGVRSQEGHSRECPLSSLIRSGCAISSASSPPCGGIRWLVVEAVKSVNLPGSLVCNLHNYSCLDMLSRRRDYDDSCTLRPGKEYKRKSNSPAGDASRRRHQQYAVRSAKIFDGQQLQTRRRRLLRRSFRAAELVTHTALDVSPFAFDLLD